METLFEAANVSIVAGYLVLAVYLAPRMDVRYRRTKVGGVAFFSLCAFTHFMLALHGLHFRPEPAWLSQSTHDLIMVATHVAQAVAVMTFISGLHREYVDQRTAHTMWLAQHRGA